MKLIKKLGLRPDKNTLPGNQKKNRRRGLFLCPFCNQEVEKDYTAGLRDKSCGCARGKTMREKLKTHGASKTRLYTTWLGMKARCTNPKSDSYKYYGGKGIKVCSEWMNSFESFQAWSFENEYNDTLVIDRKNSNKDYTPSNCRFVSHTENNRNREYVFFSLEKANEIRKKYKTGKTTQIELAKEYFIPQPRVSLIIRNEAWVN
jgi:uncharacterized protein (UPF0305 family)